MEHVYAAGIQRVSDYTAFFDEDSAVEFGQPRKIFTRPEKKQTEYYITGRFGLYKGGAALRYIFLKQ